MSFNKKKLILSLHLLVVAIGSAFSQKNDFNSVLLSRESDYEYRYKPRTRDEILIDFQYSIVYYRKKFTQKIQTFKFACK